MKPCHKHRAQYQWALNHLSNKGAFEMVSLLTLSDECECSETPVDKGRNDENDDGLGYNSLKYDGLGYNSLKYDSKGNFLVADMV
jgi:hypothetical protein